MEGSVCRGAYVVINRKLQGSIISAILAHEGKLGRIPASKQSYE